jgi:TRAP-type C4-dicarboxylate transport system permease small subunit
VVEGIKVARASNFVSLIPRAVLVLLMIVMLADMMLGVFFRYVVGQALPWSEEVGTLSLIWLTFVGGAIGITRGSHFSIQLLQDSLRPDRQRMVRTVIALLIALFGVVLAPYGLDLTIKNSTSITPGLGLSSSIQYASAFVGGVLIVCYSVVLALDAIRGREARHP